MWNKRILGDIFPDIFYQELTDNDITGIDLYLSAFGVALNVFSKSYPILDNTGNEVRPEVAFAEARKAIDLLTKAMEIAFKVIPDSIKEKQTLINLWLGIDEIKSKVRYFQGEII